MPPPLEDYEDEEVPPKPKPAPPRGKKRKRLPPVDEKPQTSESTQSTPASAPRRRRRTTKKPNEQSDTSELGSKPADDDADKSNKQWKFEAFLRHRPTSPPIPSETSSVADETKPHDDGDDTKIRDRKDIAAGQDASGLEIEVLWSGTWAPYHARTWESVEGLREQCEESVDEYFASSGLARFQLHPREYPMLWGLPLNLVPALLRSHRRIAVLSGAGISVSAGIPTFSTPSPSQEGARSISRKLFTASSIDTPNFHNTADSLFDLCHNSKPTPFHHLLADSSRVRLHITQNIDCLETSLPALDSKTVRLHGRVDILRCDVYPGQHRFHRLDERIRRVQVLKKPIVSDLSPDYNKQDEQETRLVCPTCRAESTARRASARGDRGARRIGKLEPDIRRYGDIEHAAAHDEPLPTPSSTPRSSGEPGLGVDSGAGGETLPSGSQRSAAGTKGPGATTDMDKIVRAGLDAIIIAGTELCIPSMQKLVATLCDVVHDRGGPVIWLNIKPPSAARCGKKIMERLDYAVVAECDAFAEKVRAVLVR